MIMDTTTQPCTSTQSAAITSTTSPQLSISKGETRKAEDDEDPLTGSTKRFRGPYSGRPKSFLLRNDLPSFSIGPLWGLRTKNLMESQAYLLVADLYLKRDHEHFRLLTSWGLPDPLCQYYLDKGITELFSWQVQALFRPNVLLYGRNLVYSAPTSAGKSMVADMLMYKTLFERRKKVMIVLPFVSITLEKVASLKSAFRFLDITVESFAGNVNPVGGFARVDVAVCTIEKANNMINRLIEAKKLSEIGLVIVDELHMLGDTSRGYLLELLLSKLLYASQLTKQTPAPKVNPLQIVGMSATIPNLEAIATWLDAELYISDYRPVPLFQRIVRGEDVLEVVKEAPDQSTVDSQEGDDWLKPVEAEHNLKSLGIDSDNGPLMYYAMETVSQGHSALVFCPRKNDCEVLACKIAECIFDLGRMRKPGDPPQNEQSQAFGGKLRAAIQPKAKQIQQLMKALEQTATGFDRTLELALRFGVAFHHAGISHEERSLIERGFRDGTIKVLCSTTTLSAGVNLPARRVLISSPRDYAGAYLDVACYRQMIGRAGRTGIDTRGESMLFCRERDYHGALKRLVAAKLPSIKSCLLATPTAVVTSTQSSFASQSTQSSTQSSFTLASQMISTPSSQVLSQETLLQKSDCLKRAILEVVSNGTASSRADINAYIDCTFYQSSSQSSQSDSQNASPNVWSTPFEVKTDISEAITEVSNYLKEQGLIEGGGGPKESKLTVSQLGKAIVASGVTPDDGQFIVKELNKVRQNLYLINDLHLIYQVTPPYVACNLDIDWNLFYMSIWPTLGDRERRVADLVGVKESFIHGKWLNSSLEPRPVKNSDPATALLVHQRFYASLALNDLVQETPLVKVAEKYAINKGHIQSLQQNAATFAGMLNAFCEKLGHEWESLALLIKAFQPRLAFGVHHDLVELMRVSYLTSITARQLYNKGLVKVADLINCQQAEIEAALRSEAEEDGEDEKIYVPALDKFVDIPTLAVMIIEEARIQLESEMGKKFEDPFEVGVDGEHNQISDANPDLSGNNSSVKVNESVSATETESQ